MALQLTHVERKTFDLVYTLHLSGLPSHVVHNGVMWFHQTLIDYFQFLIHNRHPSHLQFVNRSQTLKVEPIIQMQHISKKHLSEQIIFHY